MSTIFTLTRISGSISSLKGSYHAQFPHGTHGGSLLTWPNVLEHKVRPFRLQDPSQPGHRKIPDLFLIDPNLPIISTSNVPCQRRDWWTDAIMQDQSAISLLSPELRSLIFDNVDFPIGPEDAKELRRELMKERKVFVRKQVEAFREHEFSLCEH